jgi:hypothetical protein
LSSAYLKQEKLFSSRNRTEVSLGKKLTFNYLPEIEKIHKVFHCSFQRVKIISNG